METAFKVGDRVKLKNGRFCGEYLGDKLGTIRTFKGDGDVGVEFDAPYDGHDLLGAIKGRGGRFGGPDELILVSKNPVKEKPINFLLKYDLDTDPVEEFEALVEVRTRIKELVKTRSSLKRDSICIYEVKKKMKVILDTSVTIK